MFLIPSSQRKRAGNQQNRRERAAGNPDNVAVSPHAPIPRFRRKFPMTYLNGFRAEKQEGAEIFPPQIMINGAKLRIARRAP